MDAAHRLPTSHPAPAYAPLHIVVMITQRISPLLFVVMLLCSLTQTSLALAAGDPKARMPAKHNSVLKQYCYDCHDSQSEEGDVNLQSLTMEIDTIRSAETWQKVLNALNSGEMPPKDAEPLPANKKSSLLEDLSAQLVVAREILSDSGGMITMRRLNRREYENTVFDLLGVHVDAEDLPDDAKTDGFDTSGASLFFSSDQFEQYVNLGRKAIDAAFVFAKTTS